MVLILTEPSLGHVRLRGLAGLARAGLVDGAHAELVSVALLQVRHACLALWRLEYNNHHYHFSLSSRCWARARSRNENVRNTIELLVQVSSQHFLQ